MEKFVNLFRFSGTHLNEVAPGVMTGSVEVGGVPYDVECLRIDSIREKDESGEVRITEQTAWVDGGAELVNRLKAVDLPVTPAKFAELEGEWVLRLIPRSA